MVAALSSASSYATSAIATADAQIAAVTSSVSDQIDGSLPPSSAPFGSSAVAAPPVTGTQPSSAASQVFQALQTDQPAASPAAPVSHSSNYDLSYQPDSPAADDQGLVARPNVNLTQQSQQLTAAAAASFTNSVQALQTPSQVTHRILDVTT